MSWTFYRNWLIILISTKSLNICKNTVKNYGIKKHCQNKCKDIPQNGNKYLQIISNKGLVSKIYKEIL